jgi:HEAT repeat protein
MRATGWVMGGGWWVMGALMAVPLRVDAQSLTDRVSAQNGFVTFHFAARDGVCGDGESFIRTGRHQYHGMWSSHTAMEPCVFGPVQVRLFVDNGTVDRVQYWVGPLRDRAARDLGAVSAPEAARYLMAIATRGSARASAKAIMPAVLADSSTVWPALLAIAKDRDTRNRGTRQEAALWLSRFASGAIAGHRDDPFAEDDADKTEDEELKTQAVFVASQLPRGEGIPLLLETARSNNNPRIRASAMFWLGQSGDERAIALFESVLR